MVDVVTNALAVTDINQRTHYVDDIFLIQNTGTGVFCTAQTTVELHPANGRQIVTLGSKEQVLEQLLGGLFGGWLARTHHAVDFYQCIDSVSAAIGPQSLGNIVTAIEFVGVNHLNGLDTSCEQTLVDFHGQFSVTLNQDFTCGRVNDWFGQNFTQNILSRSL